jgi:hypothetical protein
VIPSRRSIMLSAERTATPLSAPAWASPSVRQTGVRDRSFCTVADLAMYTVKHSQAGPHVAGSDHFTDRHASELPGDLSDGRAHAGSHAASNGCAGCIAMAPFLLLGFPAGAWIDRRRRRPIMIVADLGRAASLGAIPVSAALRVLSMPLLYACVFVTGTLQVFFELSDQSYVPVLVGRERLMRANSRIQASMAGAEVGGPGIAGMLTQVLSAPIANKVTPRVRRSCVPKTPRLTREEARRPTRRSRWSAPSRGPQAT